MGDPVGAFVPGQEFRLEGDPLGPLRGLTFAAKDLFDVAGRPTGGGNPDWARTHPTPEHHSYAVETLLGAGATLIGKTITDEVSLGILGENVFFGTPVNSLAPDHVPGGSSSGSAAAVAGGLCDFAIGTDTGGSVRVPASFCGLYGIRPTHGRVDLRGMLAQAPSSDTTGWFARDAVTMEQVCSVMFDAPAHDALPRTVVVASDAFAFAGDAVTQALAPMLDRLRSLIGESRDELLAPQGLSVWGRAQRTIQPHEAYATFREWLDRHNPALAFNAARGLMHGASVTETDLTWARLMREEARARMHWLVPHETILVMPSTPFPAPRKNLPLAEQNPIRERILCLCAHGGLAGFPQLSIPGGTVEGLPIGLSIVGARGHDMQLAHVARKLAEGLRRVDE